MNKYTANASALEFRRKNRSMRKKEGKKKRRSDKIIFLAISHRLVVELGRSQSIKATQTSTAR